MNRNDARRDYWFPAKRSGLGWGLPITWQGWAVMGAYVVVVGLLIWHFGHASRKGWLHVGFALATAALVLICWLKGEKLNWRGRSSRNGS